MEQNLYSHTLLIIVRCPTSPAQAPTAVCIPLLPLLASHFSLFLIDSRAAPNPPSFVQFPPPLPYNPYTICPRVECSFLQNHKRSVCRLFSRAPLSLSSLHRVLFLCRFRISFSPPPLFFLFLLPISFPSVFPTSFSLLPLLFSFPALPLSCPFLISFSPPPLFFFLQFRSYVPFQSRFDLLFKSFFFFFHLCM